MTMTKISKRAWCASAIVLALSLGAIAHAQGTDDLRYYVVPQSVTDPGGSQGALAEDVRRMFLARLGKRADVALDAPAWLPSTPLEMKLELSRRGVRAYEASVQIDLVQKIVGSLPNGRRTLEVSIRLHIFGNTLPDRIFKIGGAGEAQTTVFLAENADVERVAHKLLLEVGGAALDEAIVSTEKKIALVAAQARR